MTQRILRTALFTLSILCVGGMTLYALFPTLMGPTIVISTPTDFAVSESSGMTLTGSVEHFSTLSMNGRRIITRTDGSFEERMLLAPGTNTFILEAVDSFGTKTVRTVAVVHTPSTEKNVETARIDTPQSGILPLEAVLTF